VSWVAEYSLDGRHYQQIGTTPLPGPTTRHDIVVRQARSVLVTNPDH
jgi:hypothetical protein